MAALAASMTAEPVLAEFKYHRFNASKDKIVASVRTVAVRPIMAVPTIPGHDAVLPQLEAELTKALEAAGYRVVPSNAFDSIWRDNARRLGGVFDVVTAELDEKTFETCYEYTTRELARLHDIDAVVVPALKPGAIDGGFVETARAGWLAYAIGDVMTIGGKQLRTSKPDQMQLVEGIYFDLSLFDLSGASLYGTSVPIEWTRVYWNRSYIDRDRTPLSNPETNAEAVRTAVKPLDRATEAQK